MADFSPLASRVAVRNASKVDVGVRISPHKVKDIVEARAVIIAVISNPIAASIFMTNKQLNYKSRKLEESINE